MGKDRLPTFDMEAIARLQALTAGKPRVREDSMSSLIHSKHIEPLIILPKLTSEERHPYTFKGKDYATAGALNDAMKAWEGNMNDKGGLKYKSTVTGREYPGTGAGAAEMARDEQAWNAWRRISLPVNKIILQK